MGGCLLGLQINKNNVVYYEKKNIKNKLFGGFLWRELVLTDTDQKTLQN
jgi:hypothetical protein